MLQDDPKRKPKGASPLPAFANGAYTDKAQLLHHWEWTGQAKIALQTKGEEDILLLQATAQSLNLVARVIQDA